MAGAIWGPGLFIAAWVLAGLLAPNYPPVEDHISDLAAVDAPTRVLMSLGFAAFAIGAGSAAWPLRRLVGWPAALALGVNAALTLGVMLTPVGGSPDIDVLHGGFAGLAYVSLAAVGPLASLTFRRRGLALPIASLAVGLITLACLWASLGDTAPGLFQRLGLTATDVWLMTIGFAAVFGRRRADERAAVGQ